MDYGRILSRGFTGWLHNGTVYRNMVFLALVSLAALVLMFLAGMLFFASPEAYMEWSLGGSQIPYGTWELEKALGLGAIIVLVGVVVFFAQSIFRGRILRQALLEHRNVAPFEAGKGIRFALLQIISGLIALFSWYNKKWLLLLAAGIVLCIAGGLVGLNTSGAVLLVLGILIVVAYLFVVIYNSLRLTLAEPIFVEKDRAILVATKEAWEMGKGKVFSMFIALFIVGLVLGVAVLALSIPLLVLQFLAALQGGLTVLTFVVMVLTNLVSIALSIAISDFALVELYRQIEAEPRQA